MTVRLTADITYGKDLYTPIGDVSNSFQGVFYGDGHTVKYTAKNQKSSRRGLFGKIKNAKIYDVTVKGTLTTTVGDYMGGLVGYCESSTIERCSNRVKVTTTGYQSYVGGIAAYVTGSGNVINECSNYANITANNSSSGCTGGIVGYEGYGSSLTISNCYNAGNITGKSSSSYYCIGGIVGAPMSNTSLTNVYNVGTVTNTNTSYASKYNGALCGYFSVDVTNGHWLSGSSAGGGVYSNSSVTGEMTETEMKSADFITTLGDSFVADEYSNNKGYPVLSWENVEGSKKISSLYIGTSKTEGTTSGDVTTVKGGTASAAPTITVTAPDEGWIVGDNDFTVSCDVPVAVIVKHADGTYTKVCVDSDDNSCTATLAATDSIYVAVKGDVNGDGVVKNSDVTRAKAIINGKYTTDADYLSLVADVDADEDGKLDAKDISVLKAYVLGKGTIA